MFVGEKTWVFWFGLIILALASVAVFAIVWYNVVIIQHRPAVKYQVPFVVGAVVFIFIGLHMITSGVKEKTARASAK